MDPLSLPSQGEAETLSLPDFRDSIYHKLLTGDLRNQFMKLLVWEGVNADLCMACTGLRESSLSRGVVSQDVGTHSTHLNHWPWPWPYKHRHQQWLRLTLRH